MTATLGNERTRLRARRLSGELVLVGVGLVGFSFVVVLPHVLHGGLYADDWAFAASHHFLGWWRTSVSEWRHETPERPILALLHPLPYALFGRDPRYVLAASLTLAALAPLSFFAFLRALGIELRHALALAFLAAVFPWSDAVRLWPSDAIANVAVIAFFLGMIAALRAFEFDPVSRRAALALHGLSVALYLVSILTVEIAPAAILCSGLIYRTRTSWRALRARWLFDAVLVLVVMSISVVVTSRVRNVGSWSQRLMDIPRFVREGISIFSSSFLPQAVSSSGAKAVVLVAAVAIVAAALIRRSRSEVRAWLTYGAAGVCGVAVAFVMFLGSSLFPLNSGIDDRVNTLAAYGYVLALYSLLALLGLLSDRRSGRLAAAVLVVGSILVGAGFVQRVRVDIRRYDAAAAQQSNELSRLMRLLPRPPHATTVFAFDYPAENAPGVPIFSQPWDLGAAVRLLWDDRSLRAVPIYAVPVSCGQDEIRSVRFDPSYAGAYGHAVFVDVVTGNVRRIPSRKACLRARKSFLPGQIVAER